MSHHVYILQCVDDSYYVGTTRDLESREAAHNEGRGATHTRLRHPVRLVYSESFPSLTAAVQRERQLKRWSRAKKEALIAGDWERLNQLSRSRWPPA